MPRFLLILGFTLFLAHPARAQGYIDPGSGAMIWQILLASLAGAVFFLRKFFMRRGRDRRR